MNVKYDWEELRRKFITGDYTTIKEFAEKEKVPYSLTRKHSARGHKEGSMESPIHSRCRLLYSGFRISFRRVFNCDDNAVDTALYSNSVCGIQRNNIRISDDGTAAVGFKA